MLKCKIIRGWGVELSSDGVKFFWPGKPHCYPLRRRLFAWPWQRKAVRQREKRWQREEQREYRRLRQLGASHDAALHGAGMEATNLALVGNHDQEAADAE